MRGQWIGRYEGKHPGTIIVNADALADRSYCVAYVRPFEESLPTSKAILEAAKTRETQEVAAEIYAVEPDTNIAYTADELQRIFGSQVEHSRRAAVKIRFGDSHLEIDATTELGIDVKASLVNPPSSIDSQIDGKKVSWREYKDQVSNLARSKLLFRGQKEPWRLSTNFHRSGRFCVNRFIENDVQQVHRRLSGVTDHLFDLRETNQNGAFFSLIQHHGYPTPLLDWSRSPYVAAFFALRDWQFGYDGEECCRVFLFDADRWESDFRQVQNADPTFLNFTVIEFLAIDNPRLVPQQSVTTLTNIDRVEEYLLSRQKEYSRAPYLTALDIPAKERELALDELKFMGISAGSMFPGIEGVCEELRESNFDR